MLGIVLNRESELQLWRQLYLALRDLIVSNQLKGGEILPSTREFAKDLEISRNTVCTAYELLIAEGYLISHQGAPTRVADHIWIEPTIQKECREEKISTALSISVSFRTGGPDLNLFPHYLWKQLVEKALGTLKISDYGYGDPQGLISLREEIAAWLFRSRGLKVEAEDIFITAGATQGLYLTAELLCANGRKMMMENPCHTGMLRTFINKNCSIVAVDVDEDGIRTDDLIKSENVNAIYVTPSHQFPLGGILSASRRAELIHFARQNDVYIIEDDYDSEFRYRGKTLAPLYGMDPQRVIYVGTFSKTVFPALRVGYLILPRLLQKRWCDLRTHADVQSPPFEQEALALFLHFRKFDRHVHKMRKIYHQRREALFSALVKYFGDDWHAYGDDAGLHVAIDFPRYHFDQKFKERCKNKGILVTTVENYCIEKGHHQSKLLIGYGHLMEENIEKGIKILSEVIEELYG
jgi:GntR family transcriptional regulator/MocR family aminotransferase